MSAYGDGGGWVIVPGKGLVKVPIWNPKEAARPRQEAEPWIAAAGRVATLSATSARLRSMDGDREAAALASRIDREAVDAVQDLVKEMKLAVDRAGVSAFFDDYCGSGPKPWPWPPFGRIKAEQIATALLDISSSMSDGAARDAMVKGAVAELTATLS